MSDDDWVTDPNALKTIIAINGIAPGDQVRITVRGTTLGVDQEGEQVVTHARGWGECPGGDDFWNWNQPASWADGEPIVIAGDYARLYTERSIVGWKPAKR